MIKECVYQFRSLRVVSASLVFAFIGVSCSNSGEDSEQSFSELCFIGDSITFLWDLEYYFPGYHIHKHAKNDAKVQDIDNWDVSDCRGMPTFFLMGTNNIGWVSIYYKDAEDVRQEFMELFLQRVISLEASPLWVISILPRHRGKKKQEEINQNIEIQNSLIKNSLDSLGEDFRFIDVFDLFLNGEYRIDSALFNDGLHPSEKGYEILVSEIQKRI